MSVPTRIDSARPRPPATTEPVPTASPYTTASSVPLKPYTSHLVWRRSVGPDTARYRQTCRVAASTRMASHSTIVAPGTCLDAVTWTTNPAASSVGTGQLSHRGANWPDGNKKKNRTNAVQLMASSTVTAGRILAGIRFASISQLVPKTTRKYAVKRAIGFVHPRQATRPATANQTAALSTVSAAPNAA